MSKQVQISITDLYISNQKMLYNIQRTNLAILEALGGNVKKLKEELFELNPVKDLGINDKKLMDTKKC